MSYIKNILKYHLFAKKDERLKENKKCIIFLYADYPNLGDVGISLSQKNFLKKILPDYKIICYSLKDSIYYLKDIKRNLSKNDVITLIGGGNFGDTYLPFEETRRLIVEKLHFFKIVSFPQTIHFENEIELEKSKRIYNNSNLVIFAREQMSYDLYSKHFKNIELCPDIVLNKNLDYNKYDTNEKNKKILFLFRDDCEISFQHEHELKCILENEGFKIDKMDTVLKEKKCNFEDEIHNLLNAMSKYDIIFTDRLHGMIFSINLGVPVIVFNNSNGKIKSTYETWLKNNENIVYLDKFCSNDIINCVRKFQLKTFKQNMIFDYSALYKQIINKE